MQIRKAEMKDIAGIDELLAQVLDIHHQIRPDLFKKDARKYNDEQLKQLILDDERPIFVGVDEKDQVIGYAFCIFQQYVDHNILTDIKTLYIDDLCVDEKLRHQNIGKQLYDFVVQFACEQDCYNVTLNVWSGNENALHFYEKCGLKPQKIGMEVILKGE